MLDKVREFCGDCRVYVLEGAAFCIVCGKPVQPGPMGTNKRNPLEDYQRSFTNEHSLITEGQFPGIMLGRSEEPSYDRRLATDQKETLDVAGNTRAESPAGEGKSADQEREESERTHVQDDRAVSQNTLHTLLEEQQSSATVTGTPKHSTRTSGRKVFLGRSTQFVQDNFQERVVRLHDLPQGIRLLSLFGYASVAVLLVTLLLFEIAANRITNVVTLQLGTDLVQVPLSGAIVSLLAFAVGWSLILTGASDCRRRVFLPILGFFVVQAYVFSSSAQSAGASIVWWLVLALAIALVVLHLFTRHLRYWRDLPLAEFTVWLGVMALLIFSSLYESSTGELSAGFIAILLYTFTITLPFWLILGLETVELAVKLSRTVSTGLSRRLGSRWFHRVATLLLVFQLTSIATYAIIRVVPSLQEAVVSRVPVSFVWMFWGTDSLLAIPLVLGALAVMVARRWTVYASAVVLTLGITISFMSLAISVAVMYRKDVVELGLSTLPMLPPVLLFVALITYNMLNFGARFVNHEGNILPRAGRVPIYLGTIILVLSILFLFGNARTIGAGVQFEEIQNTIDSMFYMGLQFLGPFYILWIVLRRRDLLLGAPFNVGEPGLLQMAGERRVGNSHNLGWLAFLAGGCALTLPYMLLFVYFIRPAYGAMPAFQRLSPVWITLLFIAAILTAVVAIAIVIRAVMGSLSGNVLSALIGAVVWGGFISVIAASNLGYVAGSSILDAGRTSFERFEPPVSLTLDNGWRLSGPETEENFAIARRNASPEITFHNPDDVYNPESPVEENILSAPDDMVAWYENHPHISVSRRDETVVGGAPGVQLDIVFPSAPEQYISTCSAPCVPLFPKTDGGMIVGFPGQRSRAIILDVQEETVLILINSLEWEDLQRAEGVLNTVEWEPSS